MGWTKTGNIRGLAASIAAGIVSTLSPGASATVTNSGTSSAAVFDFGIPQGAVGPAGLGTVTPSTPSRVIGTAFQPSTTKATACAYSVLLTVTNPLLAGTSTAQVSLFSDASNPPTTERCRATAGSSVGLTVTVQIATSNTILLSYIVPANHFVKLVSTTTGTATTAISVQTEETLG